MNELMDKQAELISQSGTQALSFIYMYSYSNSLIYPVAYYAFESCTCLWNGTSESTILHTPNWTGCSIYPPSWLFFSCSTETHSWDSWTNVCHHFILLVFLLTAIVPLNIVHQLTPFGGNIPDFQYLQHKCNFDTYIQLPFQFSLILFSSTVYFCGSQIYTPEILSFWKYRFWGCVLVGPKWNFPNSTFYKWQNRLCMYYPIWNPLVTCCSLKSNLGSQQSV